MKKTSTEKLSVVVLIGKNIKYTYKPPCFIKDAIEGYPPKIILYNVNGHKVNGHKYDYLTIPLDRFSKLTDHYQRGSVSYINRTWWVKKAMVYIDIKTVYPKEVFDDALIVNLYKYNIGATE